jgi:hypothetical protein
MRISAAALLALSFFGLGADTINFDDVVPPSMPPGWTATATRDQRAPHWQVIREMSAPSRPNVFAQTSTDPGPNEFPLAVFDRIICRDADLGVKFRISSRGRNHTAGIVWRYQDEKNYYLLHFSVDQKNIVLFHMENGQLHPIPIIPAAKNGPLGVPHDVHADQWYVVKLIVRGPRIRVLFGNRLLFEVMDDSLPTPGKTGLWTRGGTIAWFDDFRVDKKG